jgi:tetratricopeptide (TPR) repeat protein
MEELVREGAVELERQDERRRRRVRLLAEAIRFDELVLDAGAATEKLRQIAELTGLSGWEKIGAYLFATAAGYFERGVKKGENSAILIAVAAYRATLEEYARERVPLDWAATQNNLGNALWRLGERESGTARLEEAVVAYRAALEEYTRECAPLEWAATRNNLGAVFQTLVPRVIQNEGKAASVLCGRRR